jgi:hypothetical protein
VPTFKRDPAPEALSHYREALQRGAPEEELERLARELDPDLVAIEHWSLTSARRTRPQPDPAFVSRLRRELAPAASPPSTVAKPLQHAPTWPLDVRRPDPPPTLPFTSRERPRDAPITHPRWTWGQLAAAAVLVFMLVGSVVLVRHVTFERPLTQLGAVGEPTTETLVDATIANLSQTYIPLAVERWRFQPGATLTIPAVDGPQWVVADTVALVATVNGEAQPLASEKSIVVPAGQILTLHNPGLGEASALRGVAGAGFALEEYDRDLVTKEIGLDTAAQEALPPGRSHIVFDRLTIPPGTTLSVEAATGHDWFDVITGQLGLTLIGDNLPAGWQSGRERELAADDAIPVLVPGTEVSLHNIGEDPLVLLRLRVSSPAADAVGSEPTG